MRRLILAALAAAVVLAGCGSDPMQPARDKAAKLTPENTAKRIQADYRKRGVSGRVRCVDFKPEEQRCTVRDGGKIVARLDVRLNLSTGALDVRPQP